MVRSVAWPATVSITSFINVRSRARSRIGIFAINVLGSIVIGVVGGIIASGRWSAPYETRVFVIVGLLGGFTTFSSFSFDTLALARDGHLQQAVWNVVGQVVLSLVGVAAGYQGTVLALSLKP